MTDTIEVTSAQPEPIPAPVVETPVQSAPEVKADEPIQEVETPETDAGDEPADDQPKAKKPGGISKRFSEITAEKYAALEEAARHRAENDSLRRQLAERAAPAKPAAAAESFDPFNQEQVESTIDQRVEAKLKEALTKREAEEKAAAAVKRVNDFASKIDETHEGAMAFLTNKQLPVTQDMADYVFQSPDSLLLGDFLGSNPSESARIASLPSEGLRGAELARLEMKLKASSSPPPKVTKAPAPVPIVGARAAAGTKNPDDMTQTEYEAWRNQDAKRA